MGFIHSKNLRATARLIVLSVMEVNFRMSRCNIFFSFSRVMFIVYIRGHQRVVSLASCL